ncbi:putative Na+/H+ Antiporter [Helicobacter mustelae 12198]|uniref:Putative Na+/H+ Antiporter n=1 Tax=Helicobacter mustelae (strain ATCC 43772 / CCUG 25715 / CIP 103759 / LMG 18044 / NCTC 12198 / R85-136P) TaxID=679897 RepID=D3UHQ8_HELM1|nr:cation:proton antiporter [Helicobacter mustelae]CBG40030.1 putative Na+/H+ Antiporter [Helicobacter mustelae 12198]SQH71543.1 Na+/H+ antiporter [Helicobacter mustelae]
MEELIFHHLITFSLISISIGVAPFLSKITHIPIVVVEMLLGTLGVYYGIFESSDAVDIFAKIGFLFLMFLCGMEVNLRDFRQLGKSFLKYTIFYFVLLYAGAFLLVLFFGLPSIFVAALPVMSLGMIMALIREYGKEEAWLSIALKTGIVGELLSIGALVFINGIYSHGFTFELYKILLVLFGFVAIISGMFMLVKILFWWFPNFKTFIMPHHDDTQNQDIRFSMMLFFVLIVVVMWLSLENVLGAFLAGMIIVTFFPYKHELIHKLNDIGFGFFIPLFFINVGMTLKLEMIFHNPKLLYDGFLIALAMLFLRLVATKIAFYKYFPQMRDVLLYALGHAMPLTFLVATAALGLKLGAMNEDTYYAFLLAAIFEGVVFSIFIKVIFLFWKKKNQH